MGEKKSLRVFLGNSPWLKEGFYGVRAGSRWPHFEKNESRYMPFPFFLAYSAAILECNNFNVLLVDGIAERINEMDFIGRIKVFCPYIIVLEVSTASIAADIRIAKYLRENLPAVKIVFCGLHYEMYNEHFLEQHSFVDYILKGEYEYTVLELVQRLNMGLSLDGIPGIIFRYKQGVILNNPDRPTIKNLDSLPWPARKFLPNNEYEDVPGLLPKPTAQMHASRGCPYNCLFCSWPNIMYRENHYRVRDAVKVVDEMEYLVRKEGYKSIYFDDDVFGIGKDRTLKICREISRRNLNCHWAIMSRADAFDREVLESMAKSGLRAIKYGVESGDQELINSIGKRLDLKKVSDMVSITKDMGINVHLTFMFGLPGETKDTIKKTIDFALTLDPDSLQFSIATPFPGSRFFKELDSKGHILSKDWREYDGYSKAVIKTEHLSSNDLEDALRHANRIWEVHLLRRKRNANRKPPGRINVTKKNFYKLNTEVGLTDPGLCQNFSVRPVTNILKRFDEYIRLFPLENRILDIDQELLAALRETERLAGKGIHEDDLLRMLGIISEIIFTGPKTIHLDIINYCNIHCIHCWFHSPLISNKLNSKPNILPLQKIKEILDSAEKMGVSDVLLLGCGETFLHPDIKAIMNLFEKYKFHLTFFSNGTLLTDELVDCLVSAGKYKGRFYFSISAGDAKTYESIHSGVPAKTYEKTMTGINKLTRLLKRRYKAPPSVILLHVLHKMNFNNIHAMFNSALKAGADELWLQLTEHTPETRHLTLSAHEVDVLKSHIAEITELAKKKKNFHINNNIKFQLDNVNPETGNWSETLYGKQGCYIGWDFMRIWHNGDVSFCCPPKLMGNVFSSSIESIWNSSHYNECRIAAKYFDRTNNALTADSKLLIDEQCDLCPNYVMTVERKESLDKTGLIKYI